MQTPKNHLTIKIGKWFEATATGPLAILALVILIAGGGVGRLFGWW